MKTIVEYAGLAGKRVVVAEWPHANWGYTYNDMLRVGDISYRVIGMVSDKEKTILTVMDWEL